MQIGGAQPANLGKLLSPDPHVSDEKATFWKRSPEWKLIFENSIFVETCGQLKRQLFENDGFVVFFFEKLCFKCSRVAFSKSCVFIGCVDRRPDGTEKKLLHSQTKSYTCRWAKWVKSNTCEQRNFFKRIFVLLLFLAFSKWKQIRVDGL